MRSVPGRIGRGVLHARRRCRLSAIITARKRARGRWGCINRACTPAPSSAARWPACVRILWLCRGFYCSAPWASSSRRCCCSSCVSRGAGRCWPMPATGDFRLPVRGDIFHPDGAAAHGGVRRRQFRGHDFPNLAAVIPQPALDMSLTLSGLNATLSAASGVGGRCADRRLAGGSPGMCGGAADDMFVQAIGLFAGAADFSPAGRCPCRSWSRLWPAPDCSRAFTTPTSGPACTTSCPVGRASAMGFMNAIGWLGGLHRADILRVGRRCFGIHAVPCYLAHLRPFRHAAASRPRGGSNGESTSPLAREKTNMKRAPVVPSLAFGLILFLMPAGFAPRRRAGD